MISLDLRFKTLQAASSALSGEASRIVSQMLGGKVDSVEIIRQGLMTFKFLVELESGQRVIVRFYPFRRASVVNQEPDLLVRCHRAGIPVPRVIGDSRTGPSSELAYVVYYMIDGTPLLEHLASCNSGQQSLLAADLAQQLFNLKTIEFEGCGELSNGHKALDSTWAMFVENSIRDGIQAIQEHSLLDEIMVEKLQRIVDQGFLDPGQSMHSLVWGDINFENIIVDSNSRLAGLIDFESCMSGDPLATLGYCFAVHGTSSFFSTLLNAWPEPLGANNKELVYFYAILRALRLARYAHLPLPTGYARDPITQIFPGMVPALEQLSDSFLPS
ncbi:MAG: aminoglycoside phosphotransferase family protein [Gammaproteobacteria bacterium]|nr:aminoglycoside phosphotransferase family protein [Gammaproteobacteria bacterium]